MATSSKGSIKTGFSGFGSNVVKSNQAAQAKQASTPAFSGAVSSAVKSGATKLTDKGSGGLQSQARSVATGSGSSTNTPTTALTDTTMPVDTLANASSTGIVDLPKTTVGTGFGDIVTAASQNNLALGLTPTGETIKTETISPEQTKALTVADQIKNIYGITPPEPTSMAGEFRKMQKELLPYRQNVNTLTAQIAEITNKAQADQLRLVGQGRGVPEVIIGGQQAQVAREAAINVLPLQAQLAAAQDDLELATETLNTWFQIKSKDVENQFNYQMKLYDTVVNYANEQQKAKLDDLRMEKQQQFELKKMAIQNQYAKDLAKFEAQLKGGTGTMTPLQAAQTQTQIQQQTQIPTMKGLSTAVGTSPLTRQAGGFWGTLGKAITGALTGGGLGAAAGSIVPGLGTAVGGALGAVGGAVGIFGKDISSTLSGETQQFVGTVDQLTKNLTKENLINAKAQGATFGALSNEELALLENSATRINSWAIKDDKGKIKGYNIDEKTFKKEIDKINNAAKLDFVLKGGDAAAVNVQILPDGTYWTTNSDGTVTKLR